MIREFADIVTEMLNDYLAVIIRTGQGYTGKHQKSQSSSMSGLQGSSAIYGTPSHHTSTIQPSRNTGPLTNSAQLAHTTSRKNKNQPRAVNRQHGFKEKTPTKRNKNTESKRYNVTPNGKRTNISPFMNRQFGSVDKSISKRSKAATPTKSHTGAYTSSINMGPGPTYRHSKKEGLEKDSFYEKKTYFFGYYFSTF